jgi:murein DD-endopeptidase MepM/ murein hydrolase activator NlpD
MAPPASLNGSLRPPWNGPTTQYAIFPGQAWGPSNNPAEWLHGHGVAGYWHTGIDYEINSPTPLLAMADGKVSYTGYDPYGGDFHGGYGLEIRIKYDNGLESLYGHQSAIAPGISAGVRVAQGQVVSTSGGYPPGPDAGNSSGYHLHLTIYWGGTDVDPAPLMDGTGRQTNAPPGYAPPKTASDIPASGGTQTVGPPAPADPNLPPELGLNPDTIAIHPFADESYRLTYQPNKPSTVFLWFNGIYIPVMDAEIVLTNFRTPGTFSATLSLDWLDAMGVPGALEGLLAKTRAQVAFVGGYVDDIRTARPDTLPVIFTGVTDPPEITYSPKGNTILLKGPDLSGLLSADANTAPSMDQFSALTPAQVAKRLADAHHLSFLGAQTTETVGDLYPSGALSSRKSGQTEWDVLTQIGGDIGFAVWMSGTTLIFQPPPGLDELQPTVVLNYDQQGGDPTQPLMDVSFQPQPHTQRDYRIVVQSYHTGSQYTAKGTKDNVPAASSELGNPDALQIITITLPPNTPQATLDSVAQDVLNTYKATEILLSIDTAGVIPVTRSSPLVVQSRVIPDLNNGKPYYPVKIGFNYNVKSGIVQQITATTLPIGIQTTSTGLGI